MRQRFDQERKPDEHHQPRAPLEGSVAAVLALQRTAGNQAVASRLARCPSCEGTCEEREEDAADAETWAAIRESAQERAVQRSAIAAPEAPPAGRELTWLRVKRNYMDLTGISQKAGKKNGESKWGHWWTEIGPEESYGWYPKYDPAVGMGPTDALAGVEGELNGVTCCQPSGPTRDYYHGKPYDYAFSPIYAGTKTDEELRQRARDFANAYSGEWRWSPAFTYQNCRSFQIDLMKELEVREP